MSEPVKTGKEIHSYGTNNENDNRHGPAADRDAGGSTWAAFINIVCLLAGTGTLGLPKAVSNGGWLSLILVVLGASLAHYNAQLVIQCIYSQPDRRLEGFAEIGEVSFGKWGRWIVQTLSFGMCLGISCIYIILIGTNLYELARFYDLDISVKIWITISGIVVGLPYVCIKTMREVTALGIFGALCTLVVVVICIVRSLEDYPRELAAKEVITYDIVNWSGIPLALTTIAFSFGGNAVFPHIEHAMQRPKNFAKATASSIGMVGLWYVAISIVCYFVYSNGVQSPVYESIPKDKWFVASLVIITLHVIMACPIYLCSFSLDLENAFNISTEYMTPNKERIVRISSRVITCAVITGISLVLPYFDSFMNLVGAITNGGLVFIVPPICHLKLFGFRKRPWYSYIIIAASLIIGAVCTVLGTIDAIKELVGKFSGTSTTGGGHH
ncbi:hypothetical protein CONCODRAFT_76940 [Conidiobolus coronatus NRRL 28638]|uniref:Amino acid transporter transmembrane domain-containing protein n=1 Tax=Conidiobolus coronatus (strain ATCC 28846 / CBS 209.66 / NRRL 28638) TaxID=796925 RepID=A0A137PH26_CONC2|nr:hypothetical protein CONCODRAFT_76940 [Conidiobolus coronatus NRRL 28638]|eukprot:KXN74309.1 hypothetical protein CONCODRAFT_76940 [Conidiobolus coronatus NRRL 28638]